MKPRLLPLLQLLPILIFLLMSVAHVHAITECLHRQEPSKTPFMVSGREVPIVVEVSHRVSHRIVSEIFKIIVVEILGYPNVTIITKDGEVNNPEKSLRRLSPCRDPNRCSEVNKDISESMINLEVWLNPGFDLENWTTELEIEDCGPLGPIGRAGWYVPETVTKHIWEEKSWSLDHWRSYRNSEVTSLFHIEERRLKKYILDTNGQHFCHRQPCKKGIFRPPRCEDRQNETNYCATLLADYPDSNLEFLMHDILKYNLLVEVAWLGPNLENYVLSRNNLTTLFFNWKPNTLTFNGKFINVAFPHCEDNDVAEFTRRSGTVPCEFEINQMQKVSWRVFKNHAPSVYHVLRAFSISHKDYGKLLQDYSDLTKSSNGFAWKMEQTYQVACRWLYENEEKYHTWIPSSPGKKVLKIGGIFPLSGSQWTQSGIAVAAAMAVDNINRNQSTLVDYEIHLERKDGKCQADMVMKAFIEYVASEINDHKQLAGILGPACSETVEPIAGVAKHFNTLIISYSAEGSLFNNREKYPYFYRTIPENNLFRYVYLELFQILGWRRVAALTEDGQKYPEYITRLKDDMPQHGMEMIDNRKFPRDQPYNMTQYLLELKAKKAFIIIGDFYDNAARAIMCEAYKQNMTARHGYQWFLPLWFASDWYNTDLYNTNSPLVNCTTAQMREAINGYISLAYKFYADKDAIMQTGCKVSSWIQDYKMHTASQVNGKDGNECTPSDTTDESEIDEDYLEENKEFSKYGGYAYDAVWVYALALDKLFKENAANYYSLRNENVTRRYMTLLNQTDFSGVSGRVHFVGSSRVSQVILWQWVNNKTKNIGVYKTSLNKTHKLDLKVSDIYWAAGIKPHDGSGSTASSSCPLESLRLVLGGSCELAIVAVNLMGFLLFLILVIVCFVVFKKKYEAKFRRTEARFRELGLLASSGILALDEWEMQRDHIVINRKLGEGAFGTVYGGEAFIEEKGWQAVAVKTLKIGADVEEKLDFLSEAEMMKRFDHTNIVRLVGVCTKGEPVYTVMEFMLYGDLKTYLLARRQMVQDSNRDSSEEVSNRQLTKMALDIARGLSYLADQKYVHRDLACRNCLVNANRNVKIADFGMCRLMYDRDYYRFNKRGMLPVRWMSPESLIDGFFTPASDVWSYGVLLYEMITFGSFPYQGLSNNQVLEYVRNFNTLVVPEGCKPELESLLVRCWNRTVSQRPAACEIVEILAHHPELISPCLDMPLASVEVEDTGSMDLNIHERSRVQSVSSAHGPVAPSSGVVQQRHNRTPLERNPSNGCAEVSNGGMVHSESSPMALHTRLLPVAKGQYVTLHCRGQDQSGLSSTKENTIGIASL